SSDGFAEGSSAQYTWMIPFDLKGLFGALGGNDHATKRLDAFFHASGAWTLTSSGDTQAEMNNEPSVGAAVLYNFAGAPYKTEDTVREGTTSLWHNAPDGIPGQDDLGAMSSSYAWSMLGLYPQYPGRAELLVFAPSFPDVVVRRSNGVVIRIHAPAAAPDTK